MLFIIVPLLIVSCNAQTNRGKENKNTAQTDQLEGIQPKVDVKVNKEFDKNGNLIRYDSTYVWSYTNATGDSVEVNIDSLMSEYKPFMGSHLSGFYPHFKSDMFLNDSLFYHDFLNPDYFMQRWNHDMEQMNRMIRQMD